MTTEARLKRVIDRLDSFNDHVCFTEPSAECKQEKKWCWMIHELGMVLKQIEARENKIREASRNKYLKQKQRKERYA